MNAALLTIVTQKHLKAKAPELRAGDVVRVHQKVREGSKERIQIFEGIVIRVRGGRGMDGTFTVRRVAAGIGIERTFPLHLASITKVEKTRHIQLRQSRPYYLREMTTRQIKKKTSGELAEFVSWEDTAAHGEEEEIKARQAAEAAERDAEKATAEAEDAAKVEAAKAKHEEVATEAEAKSDDEAKA